MKDINYYLDEIERRKGVFEDKKNFIEYVFEYACRTAEYENKSPVTDFKYVEKFMDKKLRDFINVMDKIYWEYPEYSHFKVKVLPMSNIDKVVAYEHRKDAKQLKS